MKNFDSLLDSFSDWEDLNKEFLFQAITRHSHPYLSYGKEDIYSKFKKFNSNKVDGFFIELDNHYLIYNQGHKKYKLVKSELFDLIDKQQLAFKNIDQLDLLLVEETIDGSSRYSEFLLDNKYPCYDLFIIFQNKNYVKTTLPKIEQFGLLNNLLNPTRYVVYISLILSSLFKLNTLTTIILFIAYFIQSMEAGSDLRKNIFLFLEKIILLFSFILIYRLDIGIAPMNKVLAIILVDFGIFLFKKYTKQNNKLQFLNKQD